MGADRVVSDDARVPALRRGTPRYGTGGDDVPWYEDDRASWDGIEDESAPPHIRVAARAVIVVDGKLTAIERVRVDGPLLHIARRWHRSSAVPVSQLPLLLTRTCGFASTFRAKGSYAAARRRTREIASAVPAMAAAASAAPSSHDFVESLSPRGVGTEAR